MCVSVVLGVWRGEGGAPVVAFLSVVECRLSGELKVMPETNVFAQVITDKV